MQHQKNVAGKERQQTLVQVASSTNTIDGENEFYKDMCKMMVAANIPWFKLENPAVKEVLEKYMSRKLPDESTLRKNYLPNLFNEVSVPSKPEFEQATT